MKPGTFFIALFVLTVGCSSSNFEVSEANDSGEDTGFADAAPGEDTTPPGPDSVTTDTIVSETGCEPVVNPTEIWVDAASTVAAPTGAPGCPFRHVNEAIDFANTLDKSLPRTIKLKPGTYNESAAIVLRRGLTLTGAGVGVTQLSGGGACTSSATGYKCVVRVDGGAILERVSIDAAPSGRHGVVTGDPDGTYPIVRSTAVSGASGSCCSGILATNGAVLGPNIEASKNGYGLVIWGSQNVKILAGTNKFDDNSIIAINHEGTGVLSIEGASVNNNAAGIKLGEPAPTVLPTHVLNNVTVKNNTEYGIRVAGVANAKIRNSTITGNKYGVIAIHGASNYIDLGTFGSAGNNNFGGMTNKNALAGVCALFTKSVPLDATGNMFPNCSTPRSLADLSPDGGCELITSYSDIWYRGATTPIMASCTAGM